MSFESVRHHALMGVAAAAFVLSSVGIEASPAAADPVAPTATSQEAIPPTPSPASEYHGLEIQVPSRTTFYISPLAIQSSESGAAPQAYAEDFIAAKNTPADISNILAMIQNAEDSGWPTSVKEIDIQGFASNEAQYSSENAGLGQHNSQNETLATGRGMQVADVLERSSTTRGIPVHVLKGVEEVVPPAEVKQLQRIAARHGMTLKHMVAEYDAGRGDDEIRKALSFFQADREVEVTIVTEKVVPLGWGPREEKPEEDGSGQQSVPTEKIAPTHPGSGFGWEPVVFGLSAIGAAVRHNQNNQRRQEPTSSEVVSVEQVDDESERELAGVR